jgi:hypothetical protein
MEDVTLELEVIHAVGRALARLPDADAQRRVIRWINDRFQQPSVAAAPDHSDRPGPGSTVSDPSLVVDELAEFFEVPGAGRKPTFTMHRRAGADPVDAEMVVAEKAAEPKPGIDSLVRGFVTDFQRIALEWQGA